MPSQKALQNTGDSMPAKAIATAQARAARIGAELEVTRTGYKLTARGRVALVFTWRHVEMILECLEADA